MAVAFQSIATGSWAGKDSGESMSIGKPSGLATGDLMVAVLVCTSNTATSNIGFNTLSGWTLAGSQLEASSANASKVVVQYKVADSGDVAASDFTFAKASSAGQWSNGSILRIDGQGDTSQIQFGSGTNKGSGTPSFTSTVTPTFANSLLIFGYAGADNAASGSAASYAVVTNDPTWTERADSYGDSTSYFGSGDGDGLMAIATASRTETTATGNSSLTLTTFNDSNVGVMIAIPPLVNVTVSPTVVDMTLNIVAPAVTGDANVSPTVVTMTLGVQAPTVSGAAPKFVNEDRNSATATNETKNSVTFTNETKNSASPTNQTKN